MDAVRASLIGGMMEIGKRQQSMIRQKAENGQGRAMELVWSQACGEIGYRTPHFTDRQRGAIRDMADKFGREHLPQFIEWSVRAWRGLLNEKTLFGIPPLPTFDFFYSRRDIFWAHYQDEKLRKGKIEGSVPPLVVEEKYQGRKKRSLVEMVQEERRKRQNMA